MSGNEVVGGSLQEWSQAVHLRVPLQKRQCVVVRAVASAVAIRQDLTMDEVADLELVVDEVFAELSAVAVPGSMGRWLFTEAGRAVSVHAYVFAATQEAWPRESAGRYLLGELADTLRFWRSSERELSLCHIAVTLQSSLA